MAETSLALALLGAVSLAGLELSHARNTAHIAELALLDALRAGASNHASPTDIARAFETAMRATLPDAVNQAPGARLQQSWQQRQHDSGLAAWRLDILNPGPASLADHGAAFRASNGNLPPLAYYHQALRHQENLARGWQAGKGPSSGQTVFEANLLTLRLRYLHLPLSPPARWLLRLLGPLRASAEQGEDAAIARAGLWPIHRLASVPMLSEAWAWPQRRLEAGQTSSPWPGKATYPAMGPDELKQQATPANQAQAENAPTTETSGPSSGSGMETIDLEQEGSPITGGSTEGSVPVADDTDTALCGVVLCCSTPTTT